MSRYVVKGYQTWSIRPVVRLCFCLVCFFIDTLWLFYILTYLLQRYFYTKMSQPPSKKGAYYTFYLSITATTLQQPFSICPKEAVVWRFDCTWHCQLSWEVWTSLAPITLANPHVLLLFLKVVLCVACYAIQWGLFQYKKSAFSNDKFVAFRLRLTISESKSMREVIWCNCQHSELWIQRSDFKCGTLFLHLFFCVCSQV